MIISGYTIIRELGAGGMATVYLARQDRLEREVALKVLKPFTTDIHHFAARFIKESRIVARLQHRQIVTIYDFGSYEGYHWFSMEHLSGGTLAERIKSGLDSDCTLEIIKGIAEALACAHRESIIHRDIKPQNILFRSDDTPVLTDFGIARVTSLDSEATRLTRMDMMIGSPSYMSPEQIMGQPLDQRSDLYSLGVVFYEALTGSAPFEASDVMALAMKHCTEPMPRLSGQLGRFQPILDRLLAKKPEDRFDRAEHLVQALAELTTDRHTAIQDDAAATRIVPPGSYPPQVRAERPAGRSSRAMVIGSILLTGIVAGVLLLLSQRNNGPPPGPEILTGLPPAATGRPPAASNYEQLAVLDFEQGDMGRSLALINLGLEATPSDARLLALKQRVQVHLNAQGLLARARVLAQQGDLEGASDLLDQALAQVPKEQPLAALRSKLKEQIRVVQQARAEQLLSQAQDLFDGGDYPGSLKQVDAGLGIIPAHPQLLALKERIQTHAKAQELLDRAQVLERQGDPSGALGLVNQGLTQVPDEARLLALSSKLEEQIRKTQQARAEQLLAQAQELFDRGDYQGSLEQVDAGLGIIPGHPQLLALKERIETHAKAQELLERAQALARQGDPNGAIGLVDQGLTQIPDEARLLALRSKLKEQIRETQQARAEQLLAQAQELFDRGDYQGSLEQVDAGLGIIPAHPQLLALKERIQTHAKAQELLDRAQVLERQGDPSGALGLVNQGLTQVPDEARLLALSSKLEEQIRKTQQARAEQLLAQAQELFDRGDYQGSLEQVDAGLGIIPGHPQLLALKERIETHAKAQELLERAQALARQGDPNGAIGLVDQGLTQIPDEARLLALRSKLKEQIRETQQARAEQLLAQAQELFDRGDYQGSLEQVDAGLGIIPGHPQLLELRKTIASTVAVRSKLEPLLAEARKLQAKGALDDAIARVEEALKLDPDDASIKALRAALNADIAKRRQSLASAFLEQGRAHLNKDEFEAGLEVVEAGLRQLPGDQTLLALRAELARGLEQRRQVEALLAQARKLEDAGNLDESLSVVDQVLARAPVHPNAIALRNALTGEIDEQRRVAGRIQDCRSRTPASEPLDPVPDPEAAITCWQQLLETYRDNADAKTALAGIADRMPAWTDAALAAGKILEAQRLIGQLASLAPDHAELSRMRDAIATAQRRNALLPEMVPVGGGCYRMGSPADEAEREADEHPHKVCLDAFEVARYEVSVRDFRRFIDATGYRTDAERDAGGDIGCWSLGRNGDEKTTWGHQHGADWQVPVHSRRAQEDEPAACVSWNDAHAYIEWLNEQTQEHFRLPTEAEWEYAARAGTDTARWWGNEAGPAACRNANVADEGHEWKEGFSCDDGYEWAAPIGRFTPNSLGLYDILGNVFEWTCSAYDADYGGAEARCAAPGSDAPRTLRGGSWYSGTKPVRAAYRDRAFPESRYSFLGFRLARD